jgi:hypothetical protein
MACHLFARLGSMADDSMLCLIITVARLEIGLRLWSFAMNRDITRLKDDTYRRLYSPEELLPAALVPRPSRAPIREGVGKQ